MPVGGAVVQAAGQADSQGIHSEFEQDGAQVQLRAGGEGASLMRQMQGEWLPLLLLLLLRRRRRGNGSDDQGRCSCCAGPTSQFCRSTRGSSMLSAAASPPRAASCRHGAMPNMSTMKRAP